MRSWLLLQRLFGKLTMLNRPKNLPSLNMIFILLIMMMMSNMVMRVLINCVTLCRVDLENMHIDRDICTP